MDDQNTQKSVTWYCVKCGTDLVLNENELPPLLPDDEDGCLSSSSGMHKWEMLDPRAWTDAPEVESVPPQPWWGNSHPGAVDEDAYEE